MVATENIDRIHHSVLLNETMKYLSPHSGGIYIDGTLGLGGHSLEILKLSAPDGQVIAFEWDEAAIGHAEIRLKKYKQRLTIIRKNFAEIGSELNKLRIGMVDGVLVDIGLSSLQLDQGERGFSFRKDELLDMRMDTRRKTTAATILNSCSEEELADIFFYYGDEIQSRPIAKKIILARKQKEITSSKQLVAIVVEAVPKRFHPKKIHVATKVFQGLRIAVNSELENLATLLDETVCFLKPGARFCVISFHSLEDRLVKRKFKKNRQLEIITAKPVVPTADEIRINPRARSARLRVAARRVEG